jgi:hypothetical protein
VALPVGAALAMFLAVHLSASVSFLPASSGVTTLFNGSVIEIEKSRSSDICPEVSEVQPGAMGEKETIVLWSCGRGRGRGRCGCGCGCGCGCWSSWSWAEAGAELSYKSVFSHCAE